MSEILSSLFLALVGMAVVFAFLWLLVGLLHLVGFAVSRWGRGEAEAQLDDVAAIAAGVAAYISYHRKQNGEH